MKITVWTLPNCVQCQQTKRQFNQLGIHFEEKSLESDPFKMDYFRSKGLLTAPIVETDIKEWAGFRLDKIRSLAAHLRYMGEIVEPEPIITETEEIRQNYNLGVLAGEAREQQRIIELLQDDNHPLGRALWDYWEWQDEDHPFPYGLIKGEK